MPVASTVPPHDFTRPSLSVWFGDKNLLTKTDAVSDDNEMVDMWAGHVNIYTVFVQHKMSEVFSLQVSPFQMFDHVTRKKDIKAGINL